MDTGHSPIKTVDRWAISISNFVKISYTKIEKIVYHNVAAGSQNIIQAVDLKLCSYVALDIYNNLPKFERHSFFYDKFKNYFRTSRTSLIYFILFY